MAMIDFSQLTTTQKRRIEDFLDLYFTERRDALIKTILDGTLGTGLRLRPDDKLSLMVDVEIGYADWDKIVNSKKAIKHIFPRPSLDTHCMRKAYELCRNAKRKKELEAERKKSDGMD